MKIETAGDVLRVAFAFLNSIAQHVYWFGVIGVFWYLADKKGFWVGLLYGLGWPAAPFYYATKFLMEGH